MADNIKKEVIIDKINEVIKIKFPSTAVEEDTVNDTVYHHRFTKISIDNALTFNCKESPSTNAVIKTINWNHDASNPNGAGVDRDLYYKEVDNIEYFTIPFNEIYISDDVANDLIFIWIEEQKGTVSAGTFTPVDEEPVNHFAITLHVGTFFNLILSNINIVSDNCNSCKSVNCSDVNYMLAWQGFNLAKTLGKYKQMIYYWKLLHKTNSLTESTCCCH